MLINIGTSPRTPQHLPIGSLRTYGTNLYGECIFRVVWSESRTYMVGGEHIDYDGDPSVDKVVKARKKDPNQIRRTVEYRWLPLYPSLNAWVLEKWVSPQTYVGVAKEMYDIVYKDHKTGLLTLGPYPERGEYLQCFTFPAEPTFDQVANQINLIRAGWNYSYAEKKQANDDFLQLQEKAQNNKFADIFKNAQQAFNNKPTNIRPGKKTKESIPFKNIRPDIPTNGFSAGTQKVKVKNARNGRTARAS